MGRMPVSPWGTRLFSVPFTKFAVDPNSRVHFTMGQVDWVRQSRLQTTLN